MSVTPTPSVTPDNHTNTTSTAPCWPTTLRHQVLAYAGYQCEIARPGCVAIATTIRLTPSPVAWQLTPTDYDYVASCSSCATGTSEEKSETARDGRGRGS